LEKSCDWIAYSGMNDLGKKALAGNIDKNSTPAIQQKSQSCKTHDGSDRT
jgi:hypothetical protein